VSNRRRRTGRPNSHNTSKATSSPIKPRAPGEDLCVAAEQLGGEDAALRLPAVRALRRLHRPILRTGRWAHSDLRLAPMGASGTGGGSTWTSGAVLADLDLSGPVTSEGSDRTPEQVHDDIERDRILIAEKAKEYEIIQSRKLSASR
jgi:hypothetical protein